VPLVRRVPILQISGNILSVERDGHGVGADESRHDRQEADLGFGRGFEMELTPRLRQSRLDVQGANLRFKDPGLAASFGRRMQGRR